MDGLIPIGSGETWLTALYKQLVKRKAKKQNDLDNIKELMSGVDPMVLLKYYVDPQSQEINPANTNVEDFNVSRQSTFEKLNDFFSYETVGNTGNNVLFILSDAGMGKSSLLAMIKLINLTSFWPREFRCELFKLGESSLTDIKDLQEKRKTVLLLDSLDEDRTALGRVQERILEILDATTGFHKVIITCRTQFFPTQNECKLEQPGKIEVGGYKCYAKYLSFFDKVRVDQYLGKRYFKKILGFKFKDKTKINEAKAIIEKMGSLQCRPMLLAHIDVFMNNGNKLSDDMDEYQVYDVLVDNWLAREESKFKKSKEGLLNVCLLLAVNMQQNNRREISKEELEKLTASVLAVEGLDEVALRGRSLLNKNSEGHYRFSHYSIQEFLAVKYIRENPEKEVLGKIVKTDFIRKMLLKIEWVNIPAGTFQMGSIEESDATVHRVKLDAFYMSKTPVTFSQYDLFCESVGLAIPNDRGWGRGNRPVINVSWNEAVDFCKWLSAETGETIFLPTEAQWEYACRAGTTGHTYGECDKIAWYVENSEGKTHPVAQKEANDFGLHDMLGNVWEWCSDYYGDYPKNTVENPTGPESGVLRVLRGGSWGHDGRYVRSAMRNRYDPSYRYHYVGFRFSRSLKGTRPAGREAEQRERVAAEGRSPRQ